MSSKKPVKMKASGSPNIQKAVASESCPNEFR